MRAFSAILVAVGLVTLSTSQAPAQNVAQVDIIQGRGCPMHGVVEDVPGLEVSLDTSGGPVLIMYTVQFNASPTGGITLWPVIDGVTQASGQRDRLIGDFSGQTADVTFSRVYPVERGSHTFGLRATCQGGVVFAAGWLTVYELPKSKQGHERD